MTRFSINGRGIKAGMGWNCFVDTVDARHAQPEDLLKPALESARDLLEWDDPRSWGGVPRSSAGRGGPCRGNGTWRLREGTVALGEAGRPECEVPGITCFPSWLDPHHTRAWPLLLASARSGRAVGSSGRCPRSGRDPSGPIRRSRTMRIRVGCEFRYQPSSPTPTVLQVQPRNDAPA